MQRRLLSNHHLRNTATLLVADIVVFGFIDPRRARAVWLIVGYILLGLTILSTTRALARFLRLYGRKTEKIGRHLLYYGASILLFLIGLQSIGQLTVRDVVAITPLAILGYWYYNYSRRSVDSAPTGRTFETE